MREEQFHTYEHVIASVYGRDNIKLFCIDILSFSNEDHTFFFALRCYVRINRYPWAGYCGQITLSTSQNVTIERNTVEVDPIGA